VTQGEQGENLVITREFKQTVQARVAHDPAFREALLTEALGALLSGDVDTGKAMLRDFFGAGHSVALS
jgi:hypothetical protein